MCSSVSGSEGRFARVLIEGLPFGGLGRFCAELREMGEVVVPSDTLGRLMGDDLSTWRGLMGALHADWIHVGVGLREDVYWYVRGLWSYMVYVEAGYRLGKLDTICRDELVESLGARLIDAPRPDLVVYFEARPAISAVLQREMEALSTCYGVWCGMMRGLGVQVYIAPPLPNDVRLREAWAVRIWQDLCGLLPSTT